MIVHFHRPESPLPRHGMVGMEFDGHAVQWPGPSFAAQREAIRHARSWPELHEAAQVIWNYDPRSYERDMLCADVTKRTFALAGGEKVSHSWGNQA